MIKKDKHIGYTKIKDEFPKAKSYGLCIEYSLQYLTSDKS